VETATFTCPRCFTVIPADSDLHFCPRCGLPDAQTAAADTSPLDVTIAGKRYRVLDRVAIGSICSIYRCHGLAADGREAQFIFKIARDPCSNDYVANEAAVLDRLHQNDAGGRFGPFLPAVVASRSFGSPPPRQANVLRMHDEIREPFEELYTLVEVRQQFEGGLPPPDMAWIWRRLLSILGFVHTSNIVHAAVLPEHVLIEPREHKLVLIDWCCATDLSAHGRRRLPLITGGHRAWYSADAATNPGPWLDIALAARCMVDLVGGDPRHNYFPTVLDAALQRYFQRCLDVTDGSRPDAWQLLEDFDKLIAALWGKRKFRVFEMPPKS
jgi:hypothetical protein